VKGFFRVLLAGRLDAGNYGAGSVLFNEEGFMMSQPYPIAYHLALVVTSGVLFFPPPASAAPPPAASSGRPAVTVSAPAGAVAGQGSAGAKTPQVVEVVTLQWVEAGETPQRAEAGLGDWISLRVRHLAELIRPGSKPLALYINGLELPGIEPVCIRKEGEETVLRFHLRRTDKAGPHWAELLGKPDAWLRDVEVSVGPSGCGPDCNGMAVPGRFSLILIRPWGLVIFILILLLIIGLFWRLGRSDMLRDAALLPPGVPPGAAPVGPRPFSLGRCQMAFWFGLAVVAFSFIWLITGNLASLTPSVLTLIGISATTGLGAVAIDASKRAADQNRLAQIIADRNRLEASLANLQAAPAPAAAPAATQIQLQIAATQARLADLDAQAALWRPTPPQQHQSFLHDLLADENGVSFHRLQIVIWTLVLAVVFVVSVAVSLEMPAFDAKLLALMGISSGTYLGFKFPEQQV